MGHPPIYQRGVQTPVGMPAWSRTTILRGPQTAFWPMCCEAHERPLAHFAAVTMPHCRQPALRPFPTSTLGGARLAAAAERAIHHHLRRAGGGGACLYHPAACRLQHLSRGLQAVQSSTECPKILLVHPISLGWRYIRRHSRNPCALPQFSWSHMIEFAEPFRKMRRGSESRSDSNFKDRLLCVKQ